MVMTNAAWHKPRTRLLACWAVDIPSETRCKGKAALYFENGLLELPLSAGCLRAIHVDTLNLWCLGRQPLMEAKSCNILMLALAKGVGGGV